MVGEEGNSVQASKTEVIRGWGKDYQPWATTKADSAPEGMFGRVWNTWLSQLGRG